MGGVTRGGTRTDSRRPRLRFWRGEVHVHRHLASGVPSQVERSCVLNQDASHRCALLFHSGEVGAPQLLSCCIYSHGARGPQDRGSCKIHAKQYIDRMVARFLPDGAPPSSKYPSSWGRTPADETLEKAFQARLCRHWRKGWNQYENIAIILDIGNVGWLEGPIQYHFWQQEYDPIYRDIIGCAVNTCGKNTLKTPVLAYISEDLV